MFVDGPDFFSVLAQLDIEGNILTKFFKKNPASDLGGDAITRKCLQTGGKTDRLTNGETDAGEFPFRRAPLDYVQKS